MKRTHAVPILSAACEGMTCRTCPRPWRYLVTGVELWGRGDNATFLHNATEDYRRKPVEKLTKARWRRVVRRWLLLVLPTLILPVSAIFDHLWIFFAYVGSAFGLGFVLLLRAFLAWWPTRHLNRLYVYPAARVLARVTGVKFRRAWAAQAIELPPGFGEEAPDDEEPQPVRIHVPDVALDDRMKKRIADEVGRRLGLPSPRATWREHGVEQAYADLLPQALPPASLELAEIMEEILASPIERPVIGVTEGRRVVHMDFMNDSPHTLGSAGSGAGKSTLYKLIGSQRMSKGAYAIILDFKKWSHLRWAGKLPSGRVVIEDRIPEIHDLLVRVLDELLWRKSFELEQEDELALLPTLDVYVEEINTLLDLLDEYWKKTVAERKQAARTRMRRAKESEDEIEIEDAEQEYAEAMGLSPKSPAIQAIRYGVNLGREFRIHFHFIGQSLDAKAAGGRNTRESFRTRLLARWDRKTWRMLADGVPFIACPSGAVGIWAHVHGAEVEIVRVPFMSDADAVRLVLEGVRPSLPMFHGDPRPTIEGESVPAALPAASTLREIADLLPLKADGDRMTLRALQVAASRPGFPAPTTEGRRGVAALYDPEEVLAWFRDRERLAIEG